MKHKRCGLKFTQHLSKMNLTSRERNSDESIKLRGSSVQLAPAQASWGGGVVGGGRGCWWLYRDV